MPSPFSCSPSRYMANTPPDRVRITGAVGDFAENINGDWISNDEGLSYVKSNSPDDGTKILYSSEALQWQIFISSDDANGKPVACITCLSRRLLCRDPKEHFKWLARLGKFGSFILQPSIQISIVQDSTSIVNVTLSPLMQNNTKQPQTFTISGAKGLMGVKINGVWNRRRESMVDGAPVYESKNGLIIEFCFANSQWLVHDTANEGNAALALAVLAVSDDITVPLQSVNNAWKVLSHDSMRMDLQIDISIAAASEIDEENASKEKEAKTNRLVKILVSGVTGDFATRINGAYEAVDNTSYKKMYTGSSGGTSILFNDSRDDSLGQWEWSLMDTNKKMLHVAYLPSREEMSLKVQPASSKSCKHFVKAPMAVHRLLATDLMIRPKTDNVAFESQGSNVAIEYGEHIAAKQTTDDFDSNKGCVFALTCCLSTIFPCCDCEKSDRKNPCLCVCFALLDTAWCVYTIWR